MKRVWVRVLGANRVGYVPEELWKQPVVAVFYPQHLLFGGEEGDERNGVYDRHGVVEIKDKRLIAILDRDYGTLQSARQKVKEAREQMQRTEFAVRDTYDLG